MSDVVHQAEVMELSERLCELQQIVAVLRREHDRIDGPAKRIGMHSWAYAPHFDKAITATEVEVEEIRLRLEAVVLEERR